VVQRCLDALRAAFTGLTPIPRVQEVAHARIAAALLALESEVVLMCLQLTNQRQYAFGRVRVGV
jgi:hypothetical protein